MGMIHEDKIEKRGGEWVVLSMAGKELGTYSSEGDARERLRQIERWRTSNRGP
jgi:hypothetical protein